MRVLVLAACFVLMPGRVFAQGSLGLAEVLRSVAQHHPKTIATQARLEGARGKSMSARGAFDPTIYGTASVNPTGYYESQEASVGVQQRIPKTGASIEAGYRITAGDVAPYYGERATRSAGEVAARLVVPLLANRSADQQRTDILKADVGKRVADNDLRLISLVLARDASMAYFEWEARGRLLRVARGLLAIAEERANTITQRAERGAIPRIEQVDAERVLLLRKDKVLAAQASFAKAQGKLGRYYRDQDLQPVLAPERRLPESLKPLPLVAESDLMELASRAIDMRPDMRNLREERMQSQADLKLAKNQRMPALDFSAYAARDLGDGDPTLSQTDVGIGINLKFPILQRKSRGKERQARSKIAELNAKARGLRDRIAIQVEQMAAISRLRHEQAVLANQRWEATKSLADAERSRLAEGASDLLRVNLRETDVIAAASAAIESELARNKILLELRFVAGLQPIDEASIR